MRSGPSSRRTGTRAEIVDTPHQGKVSRRERRDMATKVGGVDEAVADERGAQIVHRPGQGDVIDDRRDPGRSRPGMAPSCAGPPW